MFPSIEGPGSFVTSGAQLRKNNLCHYQTIKLNNANFGFVLEMISISGFTGRYFICLILIISYVTMAFKLHSVDNIILICSATIYI